MDKYDMQEDVIQEVKELKNSIDILSNKLETEFITLNEKLLSGFQQISNQIVNLSSQRVVANENLDHILVNNEQDGLHKPQKQSTIPEGYWIDYSYIDKTQYDDWVNNLDKYNKSMAETQHYKKILNFCLSAIKTLESAIKILFEKEYDCLSESNKEFLEAYDRYKKTYEEKQWKYTKIYLENKTNDLEQADYKYIHWEDKYIISWDSLEKNMNFNFNFSLEISFEIFNPGFMSTKDWKHKFLLIKNAHRLRHIECHGDRFKDEKRLKKEKWYVQQLYHDPNNYTDIQNVVSWFVQEVYNRIDKISHRN
ncbi:mediator of RNA polymerase II transcription subunit 8 family protein [Umezakia ovalisporum]|uniref:hypothetical protein n=1 Tax=Umezakia ovalisporum TaxID=75695 RepID=UPI002473F456|nr:hypothetical protein [Umezakia ovalisporum]MDH6089510.1 hypothetical protein [Umezakia ovalisporum Ak1311]